MIGSTAFTLTGEVPVKLPEFALNRAKVEDAADGHRTAAGGRVIFK